MIALAAMLSFVPAARAGETLYNGIVLPDSWPPVDSQTGATSAIGTCSPLRVPSWMQTAPAVIPINVGRQFFIPISTAGNPDGNNREFLVESMSNVTRTWHYGTYYSGNPLMTAVLPFSDGVWWDPAIQKYVLFVHDGTYSTESVGKWTSTDALHWTRASYVTVGGAPLASVQGIVDCDSDAFWLDQEETNPARRWKGFLMWKGQSMTPDIISPDGNSFTISLNLGNWGQQDRSTIFLNPFRQKFVYSIRGGITGCDRMRIYGETTRELWGTSSQPPLQDLLTGHNWEGADNLDPQWPGYNKPCQLYNLDCTPYESMMIGMFSIWAEPSGQADARWDKVNQVYLGFSYDGWYFHRPTPRTPLCPVTNTSGIWNYCNVQSVVGSPLIVGPADSEQLYFYASGRGIMPYGNFAIGMRQLRRDGFCSIDSGGTEGTLTTHPVRFSGKYMFVNVADAGGNLQVEVLDANGQVIAPFSKANCVAIAVDKTLYRVRWNGVNDLSAIAGQTVKFKFYLTDGQLYAFWVTPSAAGASYGYVAGGGAHYTSDMDTVGLGTVPNSPPTVTAGPDAKVMMPNTLSLAGTVSDDGLPTPPAAVTTNWSLVLGPGTVSFGSASAAATTATFSTAGTYVLRLTANDSDLSAWSNLNVTVKLPGDFNGDGLVNGADFLIWQAHYPTSSGATSDTGDANGDGRVNGADFLIWQMNYKPM
jgi:hypothetical protein